MIHDLSIRFKELKAEIEEQIKVKKLELEELEKDLSEMNRLIMRHETPVNGITRVVVSTDDTITIPIIKQRGSITEAIMQIFNEEPTKLFTPFDIANKLKLSIEKKEIESNNSPIKIAYNTLSRLEKRKFILKDKGFGITPKYKKNAEHK
jgi:hypothetical protein